MVVERDVSNVEVEILDKKKTLIEMEDDDIKFLVGLLRKHKPKNLLEVGVSAGGSSYYLLREMRKQSKLTSIDISETYYRDSNKEAGFVVQELIGDVPQDKWTKLLGKDCVECVDYLEEQKPFDFVLIDTSHVMPGEFLSFLVVLPFVKRGAPIVLHDTLLNYHLVMTWDYESNTYINSAFCTGLLLSCVPSKKKEMPKSFCNIGSFICDKTTTRNILDVILAMYQPWYELPDEQLLEKYSIFVHKYYDESCSRYFDNLLEYEKRILNSKS